MKLFALSAITALAAFSQLPARAMESPPAAGLSQQYLDGAKGQPVYDLSDQYVGTIARVTHDRGNRVAIINTQAGGGQPHAVVAAAEDLAPRADGGWLLELSAGSVAELPHYIPGEPLPRLFM